MIEAGIFTKDQFQDGKEDLLDSMARLFGRSSESMAAEDYGGTQISNKCRNIKYT